MAISAPLTTVAAGSSRCRGWRMPATVAVLATACALAALAPLSASAASAAALPGAAGPIRIPAGRLGSTAPGAVIFPGGVSVPAIAVDPRTHTVWAGVLTFGASDYVAEISEATRRVTAKFAVPTGVNSVAVDPVSGTVWTTSSSSTVVTEIVESHRSVRTVAVGADIGLVAAAADPRTGKVFVFTANGLVASIAEDSRTVRIIAQGASLVGDGGAIGVDSGRGEIWTAGYATSAAANQMYGFSENGAQVAGPITLGLSPVYALTVDPAAGAVWVADNGTSGAGELTEVDEATGTVLGSPYSRWQLPTGLAADPATAAVWVADLVSGTVSRLDEATSPVTVGAPLRAGGAAYSVAVDPSNGRVYVGGYRFGNGSDIGTVTAFVPARPVFTSPPAAWFSAVNVRADTFTVTASGFPAPVFAITSSKPPSWLALNPATGVLKVTPGPGVRPRESVKITIRATNGTSGSAFQSFTVRIGSDPVFTSPASVRLRHGRRASFTIKAAGYPVPVLKIGGRLPKGLKIKVGTDGTALLSGIPARSDARRTYLLKITASSPVGKPATQTLTVKVS